MKQFTLLPLLLALLLNACEFNENDIELGKEFQLKLGKTYEFMDCELTLTDIKDSRCPLNVNCVWEGEASLTFKLEKEDSDSSFTISTQDKIDYTFSNYALKVLEVAPHPSSTDEIDKEDYRISVRIESNNP